MSSATPFVSVVVPVDRGARHVSDCVEAIAAQDWPAERLEVIVSVSTRSDDGSAAVARTALARHGLGGRVIEDADGSVPANLNAALAASVGRVVVRVDVRSRPGPAHIRNIVERLSDPAISVVGGVIDPVPDGDGIVASAIARAHRNPFAMGGARYRLGRGGEADTAYLGGYRREQLAAVGGWDEDLEVNEDFDLHRRLARLGVVWCDVSLVTIWIAPPRLGPLVAKFHSYGRWKVRYWRLRAERPLRRQLASLAVPPIGAAVLVAVAVTRARARGSGRSSSAAGLGAALVTGAAGLMALDAIGLAGEPAGVEERTLSALASALIAAGWWTGVLHEWAVGRRRG